MDDQLQPVSEVDKIIFSEEELKIFEFWKKNNVFENSLKQSKDRPRYTFYDGPPFATGLPHYGHILAGTIKDIVTRWAHQTGHHVERRFGWDTHGLPVEYEIDKTYDIKGPGDVQKMGIKKYNDLCRGIVSRYSKEWEEIISRLGRWIDFKNDYKTLYLWYMESIWWVFTQLYNKGLVYRGMKVMPFSTACSTPLSNFEAGQNYKDVQDPSVVITFPLVDDPSKCFLAWTTTPWTLPSNLALCVNPEMDYVLVKGKTEGKSGNYILMEARLSQVFKDESEYEIHEKMKGSSLEGVRYQPLFNYFVYMEQRGAFRVLVDGYVTSESGTGVVHQAPYFGEDDFRICLHYGIISKDGETVCPVDDTGHFVSSVTHFEGMHVKEADPHIIKHLKEGGRLVISERHTHSYPFCWRSDTPLIYKAVPSWYIRVEQMVEKLLKANEETYWVPKFVKEKRFANWLRDARDWAISRNRYWGTPIPLWVSDDLEEIVCIESIEQLEKLTSHKVTDLHRENIDHLTVPSARPGKPPLKRISEVFDCWFESGSMPYAQVHYPFEHKKEFEDCFPADFIAEGIDQTRGWFYTLLVISTALFGRPPFKNLIANGLVLAADGQKMSKRKKNYPDPMLIVDKYGADALRLYLTNSPAVRGENLRFKEEEVFSLLKEVFIPWLNAYRFFVQQVQRFEKDENEKFVYDEISLGKSTNIMDRWILSFTQSLLQYVHTEMKAYRMYTVTPRLVKFVDNLTNWYVRFNRKRLKGDNGKEDCLRALETLYSVLMSMVRVMSPFTPFITEMMYQNLKKVLKPGTLGNSDISSVHYLMVPAPIEHLIQHDIETSVNTLQSVVELGRYLRAKSNCPVKYPLPEVVVIHKDTQILDDVKLLENYIKEELNVRTITTSTDKEKYGVMLKAEVNFKLLGVRLKGDVKKIQTAVGDLTDDKLQAFLRDGFIDILGHRIDSTELLVKYTFGGKRSAELSSQYDAHSDATVLILLDMTPSQEMIDEGLAREVINRVQKLRKKARLVPTDEVSTWYQVSGKDNDIIRVCSTYKEYIEATTRSPFNLLSEKKGDVIMKEETNIRGVTLQLALTKGFIPEFALSTSVSESPLVTPEPVCPWVNIQLRGIPRMGGRSCNATLLLENPRGSLAVRTVMDILEECNRVFGIPIDKAVVCHGEQELALLAPVSIYSGCTLSIVTDKAIVPSTPAGSNCYSRFINVVGNGKSGTVLLENPVGECLLSAPIICSLARDILSLECSPSCFFLDKDKTKKFELDGQSSVSKLNGCTLYL